MSDLLVKPLPERVARLEKARDSMKPLDSLAARHVFCFLLFVLFLQILLLGEFMTHASLHVMLHTIVRCVI